MFRSICALTLAAVTLSLAWAALIKPPSYQSTMLMPPVVASSGPATPVQVTTVGEMLVTAEWFDLVFRGARQDNEAASRLGLEQAPREGDDRPKRIDGTYRTLCVRLCDGFYFPISYSTSRDRFAGDAKQCEQRCPTRSRLFVHRNPGEDVNNMVDLEGRPYRSLPTALLHRTQYVADCTCRGLPWKEDVLARHRAYAEAAKQKTATIKTAEKPSAAQSRRRTKPKDQWAHNELRQRAP